jgi:HEAT repeat protein
MSTYSAPVNRPGAHSLSDLAELVLWHPAAQVRSQAIPRLCARFPKDPTTLTVFASASEDSQPDVRQAAGSASADVAGPEARALIVHLLQDPEFKVRLSAAWTLKLLRDAHAPDDPDAWALETLLT